MNLPRFGQTPLLELMRVFPATVVTGARQTGKSTLVRLPEVLQQRQYLTLDELDVLDQAVHAPDQLLERAPSLVLDEVQRAPALLISIKRAIDQKKERGRFLLTGSANLLLMERVSESLAGRAGYLTLWPLTRREQLGFGSAGLWGDLLAAVPADWRSLIEADPAPEEPWQDLATRGGYPEPAYELSRADDRTAWFENYTATYLERDVRQLAAIEHLLDLRRLMRAVCLRLGGLLNQADLARDVGLPPTTVQRYLNLLETSYQLIRLPAYAVNRTKRLIKTPKLYWSDTGLARHIAGDDVRGHHLENVVATDLVAWASVLRPRPNILYWRTTKGTEVDFVIESGNCLLPIEVKTGSTVSTADARGLTTFLDEYPDKAAAGVLLYTGRDIYWLTGKVLAVPWWRVV